LNKSEGVAWIGSFRGFRANDTRAADDLLAAAEQKDVDDGTRLERCGAAAEKRIQADILCVSAFFKGLSVRVDSAQLQRCPQMDTNLGSPLRAVGAQHLRKPRT